MNSDAKQFLKNLLFIPNDTDSYSPEQVDLAANPLKLSRDQIESIMIDFEERNIGHRGSNGYITIDSFHATGYV